jgi:hypothetical protein
MRRAIRYLCTVVTAFLLVGLGTLPVAAQEKAKAAKAVTEKVVLENEKVIAVELRYKPGDENANVPRSARVVRALTGGTLMRTYSDGKQEKIEFKAGQVRFNPAVTGEVRQYTTKNVGKSDLVLYLVVLK